MNIKYSTKSIATASYLNEAMASDAIVTLRFNMSDGSVKDLECKVLGVISMRDIIKSNSSGALTKTLGEIYFNFELLVDYPIPMAVDKSEEL